MSRFTAVAWTLFAVPVLALGIADTARAVATTTKVQNLPYVTIDHPQFIPASQATYLHPNDLLIGVTHGKIAKAYPAAILAQHGVVQDRMPDGPIAVTW